MRGGDRLPAPQRWRQASSARCSLHGPRDAHNYSRTRRHRAVRPWPLFASGPRSLANGNRCLLLNRGRSLTVTRKRAAASRVFKQIIVNIRFKFGFVANTTQETLLSFSWARRLFNFIAVQSTVVRLSTTRSARPDSLRSQFPSGKENTRDRHDGRRRGPDQNTADHKFFGEFIALCYL